MMSDTVNFLACLLWNKVGAVGSPVSYLETLKTFKIPLASSIWCSLALWEICGCDCDEGVPYSYAMYWAVRGRRTLMLVALFVYRIWQFTQVIASAWMDCLAKGFIAAIIANLTYFHHLESGVSSAAKKTLKGVKESLYCEDARFCRSSGLSSSSGRWTSLYLYQVSSGTRFEAFL